MTSPIQSSRPRLPGSRCPVVALFNHKGGVAKTTTAVNLAACWAASGLKVLLADFDAQGNASHSFGLTPMPERGVWDVLMGRASLADALIEAPYDGIYILPATREMRAADAILSHDQSGLETLKTSLETCGADVVLIDCPPSFSLMELSALTTADTVVVPTRPDPLSHEGLLSTWQEVLRLRRMSGGGNRPRAFVLPVMMRARDDASQSWTQTISAEFGKSVSSVAIPEDPDIRDAAQVGVPVCVFTPDGLAGNAYRRFAAELADRLDLFEGAAPADTQTLNALRTWRSERRVSPDTLMPDSDWIEAEDVEMETSDEDLPIPGRPRLGLILLIIAIAAAAMITLAVKISQSVDTIQ